jgi:hypothetical protein
MDLTDTEQALRDSLSRWLADDVDLSLLGAGLPGRISGPGGGLRKS